MHYSEVEEQVVQSSCGVCYFIFFCSEQREVFDLKVRGLELRSGTKNVGSEYKCSSDLRNWKIF